MSSWLIFLLVISGLLAAAYFLVTSRLDTFTGRWLAWKSSGVDDYLLFPSRTVTHSPSPFIFELAEEPISFDPIEYQYKGKALAEPLDVLLEKTGSTAFLVMQGDTLLYENYFNGNRRDSIVTSFSIAKSITSLMVGMAIDDGYLHGLDDPVTRYIPELTQVDPRYQNITLGHLLSMKSGIAFKDTDIPWHDKSRAYYHPNLREVVTHLPIAENPGETFLYNTFNPILLGIVLENATGQSVAEYFESRFWKRLGTEYDASWSIDSESDGMAKMESGLNARAIDFAKIGRLILQRGMWKGDQVVSSQWVETSIQVDPQNTVAKFGENVFYQNGWWVIGPTPTDQYTVFGWGHLGQYLFIFPDEDMIVLRFGRQIGNVDSWRQIAQQIVNRVQQSEATQVK